MCKLQNDFLLCSCLEDTIKEDKISWILRRRKENKLDVYEKDSQQLFYTAVIGSRSLPSQILPPDYKDRRNQMFQEIRKNEKIDAELNKLKNNFKKSEEYQNLTTQILVQLNSRNCFDREIDLIDKDLLSIRLDDKRGLWAEFIYRKFSWRLAKFSLDDSKYLKIVKGKIKQVTS